jgi:hypothetical protein
VAHLSFSLTFLELVEWGYHLAFPEELILLTLQYFIG